MMKYGTLVKVISTTTAGDGTHKELIPIGTICKVLHSYKDSDNRDIIVLIPADGDGRWCKDYSYPESAVEKGHFEWVKDE